MNPLKGRKYQAVWHKRQTASLTSNTSEMFEWSRFCELLLLIWRKTNQSLLVYLKAPSGGSERTARGLQQDRSPAEVPGCSSVSLISRCPLISVFSPSQSDMTAERVVKTEEGEKLAKVMQDVFQKWLQHQTLWAPLILFRPPLFQEYGVPFMETSAKTGVNVELAFLAIAK